ncbi:DUF3558 domain-containing protein [Amycolatopsis sp. cg5]|uniref:DUF3558 domain-containing protein n=1 Tax=Amycolatopsis sp. cg5 TaxID=3238802 RepID=UPI00352364C2
MTALMHRKQAFITIVLAASLTLSACSQKTPGDATPMPSPPATSGNQQPPSTSGGNSSAKAPNVSKPLDASKFVADPCLSLTATQLSSFNSTATGKRNDGVGVACDWNLGSDRSVTAEVAYNAALTAGLSHIYAQNAANFFSDGYFKPTEISGYPAAFNNQIEDRPAGHCSISVGVTDQLFFTISISGRTGTDGCKASENVAKAVVQTIQGG